MSVCAIPPRGWQCTRDAGHAGPCAAIQSQANQSTDIEHAWRAGFAAAEEALGAHGSDWLLNAIETSWDQYASDHNLAKSCVDDLNKLRLHVGHLLYAIDRGYFGDSSGLSSSAFVEPLREIVGLQSGKSI